MKQFALIGVDTFGKRVLEELVPLECEILLIDKNREIVDFYKDDVTEAYIADVINEETMNRLIPDDVDAVIIDLGKSTEASVLAVNYLKKMGQQNIYVKAETDQHGEILRIVGADHVIFPNQEAAKKLPPMLMSDNLFNYLPISNGLVMAEVQAKEELWEKTLQEADIRRTMGINVVAYRDSVGGEYKFFKPDHRIKKSDILLIAGPEENVVSFSGSPLPVKKKGLSDLFRSMLFNK